MNQDEREIGGFNFDAHGRQAAQEYAKVRPVYEGFARAIHHILSNATERSGIKVHSIQPRAKEIESFAKKASARDKENPDTPKYLSPLTGIEDMAGVRVITYFPNEVAEIGKQINLEFDVLDHSDRIRAMREQERLGYESDHYLVRLTAKRTELGEYNRFAGLKCEIQVRTVLQHAWAEIEHDIGYKSEISVPGEIRRRFQEVAGLLSIADREFQQIQDAYGALREELQASVAAGILSGIDLTVDAVQAYVSDNFGTDDRVSKDSYEFAAYRLRRLGFSNLEQVDTAIAPYKGRDLSVAISKVRGGPLTRFDLALRAALGHVYLQRLFPAGSDLYRANEGTLKQFEDAGITVGGFVPTL